MCTRPLWSCSLDTAFEWLVDKRVESDQFYETLEWINIASSDPSTPVDEEDLVMPLYPLGASYFPTNSTHILNNVEPRNVQMALDLMEADDKRFCVALRATDTGRVAKIGTIMEIEEADVQLQDEAVRRVVVTCRPVGVAEIVSVLNPSADSPESRIRRSDEYLTGAVRLRKPSNTEVKANTEAVDGIVADYNSIRSIFSSKIGDSMFPVQMLEALETALPEWSTENFSTPSEFWNSMETWQILCNTVREWRRASLSADLDRFMVVAASQKGGILNLPVHPEDLNPEERRRVSEMELQAHDEFLLLGMDPVLDCQVLLSIDNFSDHISFFANLLNRVRGRLSVLKTNEHFQ